MKRFWVVLAVLVISAWGANVSMAGFPSGESYVKETAITGDKAVGEVEVGKINVRAKTVTIELPLVGSQRGYTSFEIHATQWYVSNGWVLADRKADQTIVEIVEVRPDSLIVKVALVEKGDAGQYRLRFWGRNNTPNKEIAGDEWFWQNENSAYAYPDANGVKGYEVLIDLQDETYAKVNSTFAKD